MTTAANNAITLYVARNRTKEMFNVHLRIAVTLQLMLMAVQGMQHPCRFSVTNEKSYWFEEDGSLRFPPIIQDNCVDEEIHPITFRGEEGNTACIYSNVSRTVLCRDSIDYKLLKVLKNKQVRALLVDSYKSRESAKKFGAFGRNCIQKISGKLVLDDIPIEMSTILRLRRLPGGRLHVEGEVFSNKVIKVGWKYVGEVTLMGADGARVNFVSEKNESGWSLKGIVDFSDKNGTYAGYITYIDDAEHFFGFKGIFNVTAAAGNRNFSGYLEANDLNMQGHFQGTQTECIRTKITIPENAFSEMTIKKLIFKNSQFFGDFHRDSLIGINQLETIKFLKSVMEFMPKYESIFRGSSLKAIYIENCNTPSIKTGSNCSLNNLQLLSFKGSGFLEFSGNSFLWLSCSQLKYLNLHDANIKLHGNKTILEPVGDKLRYVDLSYSTLSQESSIRQLLSGTRITHLSLAGLQLKRLPATALGIVGATLEYLSLKGNNFEKIPGENMLIPILNFPKMELLRVLDLSGCQINYIEKRAFDCLTNLELLDLSHNYIMNLQDGWVDVKPNVLYLNLSYNGFASRASGINMLESLNLSSFERLQTLDLSYSNYWTSKRIIISFNNNLRYVSLCHCGLRSIKHSAFRAMGKVEEIDLSGNPYLGKTISMSQLRHMKSLKILHLAYNEVANLTLDYDAPEDTWKNLEYIDLSNNYIKWFDYNFFKAMPNLQILKLSHNSISFWPKYFAKIYPVLQRVFLDNNKIEKFESQTILDFATMDEVSLGNNPFICDRFVLRFLSILRNKDSEYYLCPEYLNKVLRRNFAFKKKLRNYDIEHESGRRAYLFQAGCAKINDWTGNEYQCYSYSLRKMIAFPNVKDEFDDFLDEIDSQYFNSISLVLTATTLICFFLAFLWWKWWNLRLFTKMMKNAAVGSFMESQDSENAVFEYDAFVSYTHSDRQWVTDNLIPNLERLENVKICLHERDFQVGLSILENIATSIDKSRCVVMVLSQAFVKSQWCRFEMHLAYHRLLECRRDHMILILLENIPRNVRPKTLKYLMMTTTYIQWPDSTGNAKDIELFWSRLFKALQKINYI